IARRDRRLDRRGLAREAEVGDPRLARRVEKDVLGLQVAVEETELVRARDAFADAREELEGRLGREPLMRLLVEKASQIPARQMLEDQERRVLVEVLLQDAHEPRALEFPQSL